MKVNMPDERTIVGVKGSALADAEESADPHARRWAHQIASGEAIERRAIIPFRGCRSQTCIHSKFVTLHEAGLDLIHRNR